MSDKLQELENTAGDHLDVKGKKIVKIVAGFNDVICEETMPGEFTLEDGKKVEGKALYISKVSGEIEIKSKEDYDLFVEACEEESMSMLADFFYDFDGYGVENKYEIDEYNNFEEYDSEGCEFWTQDVAEPEECFAVLDDGTKANIRNYLFEFFEVVRAEGAFEEMFAFKG